MEKHRTKQPERRMAMGREVRIQLGENKEDKYGSRWVPKTTGVHRSTQREEQKKREREREKVRAGIGEKKADKHGDRQGTRSILCP